MTILIRKTYSNKKDNYANGEIVKQMRKKLMAEIKIFKGTKKHYTNNI